MWSEHEANGTPLILPNVVRLSCNMAPSRFLPETTSHAAYCLLEALVRRAVEVP